jgi:hypothetical protein
MPVSFDVCPRDTWSPPDLDWNSTMLRLLAHFCITGFGNCSMLLLLLLLLLLLPFVRSPIIRRLMLDHIPFEITSGSKTSNLLIIARR